MWCVNDLPNNRIYLLHSEGMCALTGSQSDYLSRVDLPVKHSGARIFVMLDLNQLVVKRPVVLVPTKHEAVRPVSEVFNILSGLSLASKPANVEPYELFPVRIFDGIFLYPMRVAESDTRLIFFHHRSGRIFTSATAVSTDKVAYLVMIILAVRKVEPTLIKPEKFWGFVDTGKLWTLIRNVVL